MANTSQFDGEVHLRIARAVECLDLSWRRGEPIPLEDLLHDINAAERAELLREALQVELEHRRDRGETPAVEEYERRFPGDLAIIRPAFTEPGDTDATETEAKPGRVETLLREEPVGPTSAVNGLETRLPVDAPTIPSGFDPNR